MKIATVIKATVIKATVIKATVIKQGKTDTSLSALPLPQRNLQPSHDAWDRSAAVGWLLRPG
jgi:hypothetical protein